MTTRQSKRAAHARSETASQALAAVKDITVVIAELEELTVAQLQDRWLAEFKEVARSRNRVFLVKRLAWKAQADAEGGLSAKALAKIDQLGTTPARQRLPRRPKATAPTPTETGTGTTETPAPAEKARDPRLPPVGSTITKIYKDETHEVQVLADGFEWQGTRFKSLSKVAKAITGSIWNGYGFFNLLDRGEQKGGAA